MKVINQCTGSIRACTSSLMNGLGTVKDAASGQAARVMGCLKNLKHSMTQLLKSTVDYLPRFSFSLGTVRNAAGEQATRAVDYLKSFKNSMIRLFDNHRRRLLG